MCGNRRFATFAAAMAGSAPEKDCFIPFVRETGGIAAPQKFTFPFYYEPHELCIIAAEELQEHLRTQTHWKHNFGLPDYTEGMVIGKMFGVMAVLHPDGRRGYLAAFSGKLAGGNHHPRFVPPVFDMLTDGSFFLTGEEDLNRLNRDIERLENAPDLAAAKENMQRETLRLQAELEQYKQRIKQGKAERKAKRETAQANPDTETLPALLEELRQESLKEQYFFKDFSRRAKERLHELQLAVDGYAAQINALREERRTKSAALQQRLFREYHFLDRDGNTKSLLDIFLTGLNVQPPAGAGECAAPKLLQYAFRHGLKPLAMAEFWWGAPPASEVRKHGQFYPACRGKCEPILAHMLRGIETDENPMRQTADEHIMLPVVYEDEHLVAINKPAEFLSVPGIHVTDSVYTRMRKKYPEATGPLIVHRLDMSTSGILLIAKTREAYHNLQAQFIKRTVKKRYVALLEGNVEQNEGKINLPLRVDLEDRPRQLVCHEHGKPAQTLWNVVERNGNTTRVHFYPITGRTHQLRVHASHTLGLNAPIVGDDLYGTKADRLHLHAEQIEFTHPATGTRMILQATAEF